ncbi:hypothetical protein F2Q70_00030022 [Brassica cretica]|uniref:Uncharacterized protein n=1 Tax=Brassica cretica TaxID=69181 RepID=A0A8S9MV98_BRACR|nr:hypothetical protein F2Q70_00030022 [Brassica cretica]KAF2552895.1 hypothetical protein F2Q68_00034498 [Brassica cretica]KAF3485848.1 hypothetical protein F2Q69_00053286 [Brassica cretica]
MSYRCFGRARSLRSDRALARAWSLRSDRVLARDRSLRSDRAPARVRSLRSDRAFARSLRSDRAEWTFGRYVATEPWLKLGRYAKLFHIRKYGRFSLSEVFHFLEVSSVPGTELGVPSSGDLERSLIGDPGVWVLPGGWRK